MGLFSGRGKSGGLMNVIRCDQQDYLVWKWRPLDQDVNSTTRENSIRFGSSLRVKDGEMAVFVYRQNNGTMQDYIYGPYDGFLKTANFPVLANIMGAAYGGEAPFQAEVYFINLAGNIQIPFGIPFFDVPDPRFLDFVVPIAAGGKITFNITDPQRFIKMNRLVNFDLDDFSEQVRSTVVRRVKSVIANAPAEGGFPLVQIERKIDEINDAIAAKLKGDFEEFGINLKRFDLSRIEPDKQSQGWYELRNVTAEQQQRTINAQTEINLKNMADLQAMNAQNMAETMRIQREESQRAQRLQTEQTFIGAHALDRQADVMQTAAQSLGEMGSMSDGAGGFNPAGMMASMALGGTMAQQMAGMANSMAAGLQNPMGNTMGGMAAGMGGAMGCAAAAGPGMPPPPPGANNIQWMVAINGQQSGPYDTQQLSQLIAAGQMDAGTYVWCRGMANWQLAGQTPELAALFATASGQCPPAPPVPGM